MAPLWPCKLNATATPIAHITGWAPPTAVVAEKLDGPMDTAEALCSWLAEMSGPDCSCAHARRRRHQ